MLQQSVVQIFDALGNKQLIGCVVMPSWGGSSDVNVQASLPVPWNATAVTASGITVIKDSAGILGPIISLDPSNPQAPIITVYDSPSGASGQKLANIAELLRKEDNGGPISALTGITVDLSAAPNTTDGILILWL